MMARRLSPDCLTSRKYSRAAGGMSSKRISSVRAQDAVHGRADLVAHFGQELGFRLAGLLGLHLGQKEIVFKPLALGDVAQDSEQADLFALLASDDAHRGLDQNLLAVRPRAGKLLGPAQRSLECRVRGILLAVENPSRSWDILEFFPQGAHGRYAQSPFRPAIPQDYGVVGVHRHEGVAHLSQGVRLEPYAHLGLAQVGHVPDDDEELILARQDPRFEEPLLAVQGEVQFDSPLGVLFTGLLGRAFQVLPGFARGRCRRGFFRSARQRGCRNRTVSPPVRMPSTLWSFPTRM